jgi:hypothetical protein
MLGIHLLTPAIGVTRPAIFPLHHFELGFGTDTIKKGTLGNID